MSNKQKLKLMRLCAPVDQRYKAANPDCDTIDYGCLRSLMEHAIQLYLESSIALVLGKTVLAIATSQTFFLISRLSCRGLEAKHLMPAKSSPRSELAMAIVKWRRLAPEFCSRAHLSQSNANNQVLLKDEQRPECNTELAFSLRAKLLVCIRGYVSAHLAQPLRPRMQQRR